MWSNFGGVAQRDEHEGQQSYEMRSQRKNECVYLAIAARHPTMIIVGTKADAMCDVGFFGEPARIAWLSNASVRDPYRIE